MEREMCSRTHSLEEAQLDDALISPDVAPRYSKRAAAQWAHAGILSSVRVVESIEGSGVSEVGPSVPDAPVGETSHLKGICGLPIMGEPFDELLPLNSILEMSPLAHRVLSVMHQRDTREKGCVRIQRYRESHGCPPRKDITLKNLNFLWLSLPDLQSIDPKVELVLFLYLWLSVVVVSSSGASYVKSSSVELTVDERDFYLSLQPYLLPLRDEGLARQFSYDQGFWSI
ncbi:hypothetical protein ACLOJK_028444 [Asimina triloba]